jgi:hypothetical protein
MRGIQRAREKPSLPQMPAERAALVILPRKGGVRIAKTVRQPQRVFGHHDPVDMVAHQAIRPNIQPILAAVLFKQVQVVSAFRIVVKNLSAPIPALGDVVRKTRYNNARQAGHAEKITVPCRKSI